MFGAALVPLSQATMLDIYPAEKRGSGDGDLGHGRDGGADPGPDARRLPDRAVYNWRWVFYVNLPFGVVASRAWRSSAEDTAATQPALRLVRLRRWRSASAALQLMLDRGETKDWFGSTEIVDRGGAGGVGLYLFLVHMCAAERPFIPPASSATAISPPAWW